MKIIVYSDGSIEATVWADALVAKGEARYATPEECAGYERNFARDDARIAALERSYRNSLVNVCRPSVTR
jgi:hypothetical protein